MWNLIRWVSPRTIKETFVPPTDYRYPSMAPDRDGSDGSGGTR
jgi:1-pyrroline-5-carboxylate dehydrogenase